MYLRIYFSKNKGKKARSMKNKEKSTSSTDTNFTPGSILVALRISVLISAGSMSSTAPAKD